MFHFANLLFAGPCNARCPFCIGKQIDPRREPPNLNEYPPRGLARFLGLIREHDVREVVLTGTNTDPLLYAPLERLLDDLRAGLPAGTRLGLHTNGRLAPARIDLVRRFDKLCVSVPSFDPVIYRAAMGVEGVPDVGEIMAQSGLPVKLSCLVTEINRVEIPAYLDHCRAVGAQRVVLRKPFGERRNWSELLSGNWKAPIEERFGCPVYGWEGVQVTLWNFEHAQIGSLNLFSSGEISAEYLLAGEESMPTLKNPGPYRGNSQRAKNPCIL